MSHMRHDAFICDRSESVCITCLIQLSSASYEWVMSHMHACLTWMHHVSYEWIMSHTILSDTNKSYPIWISPIPYEHVLSHMNTSYPTWISPVSYAWVMSYMNASSFLYEWVKFHTNESSLIWHISHTLANDRDCRSLSAKEPLIIGLFCGHDLYK